MSPRQALRVGHQLRAARDLLVELKDGERIHHETLDVARERLRTALGELPPSAVQLSRGEPVIDTVFEDLT